MSRITSCATIVLIIASGAVYAADATGTYIVFGIGIDKCSKVLGMS